MSVLLETRGLHLSARGRTLLTDVNLSLAEGEIMTLVGPNGSGKSTLLKALVGLRHPRRGMVRRAPHLRVGYVPQHFQVDRNLPLSVGRFLGIGMKAAQVHAVALEVRIGHLLERPMQVLSGGELRRVLFARALLRRPNLLALDEPAAGLDLHGQGEMYRLIEQARELRGCAVAQISHDLHLVMKASDQVVCLAEGHVCCSGTPDTVRDSSSYQALLAPGEAIFHHDPHQHHHHHRPGASGHG
ncbi:metal ABC transporter ATP-binding protein [Alkalilimnicola sp. S0819]|uniref:metal ABC transporter ATP-binding protein n=1 Tax=Alkalilimnicola sp. S0819 TaxID=2613922 RepID=UPI0012615DAF|nr:metal ABC transporter ATP-binding protein [Alkalilimnicola sp. S0819]KAB7627217.1 metal ABC transporter ATP-binding protein [Alkalilimnicola sp. S0819]MPQ15930.1 ATP-binding cassette domain-containing protein [Alkalilimnicola sp. S0819]